MQVSPFTGHSYSRIQNVFSVASFCDIAAIFLHIADVTVVNLTVDIADRVENHMNMVIR